jgi:endonuclease I
MELAGGITYETIAPIPGHTSGAQVYYQVTATNSLLETRASEVQGYRIPYELTIHEIQGEGEESPYDGELVATTGLVTAVYGSTFTVQDGVGGWKGLWATGTTPELEEQVDLWGIVDDNTGNTTLEDIEIVAAAPGGVLPPPEPLTTAAAATEPYEGVLVAISAAQCTQIDAVGGVWTADDGSGPLRVGTLGGAPLPTLGSRYDIAGPIAYTEAQFRIEPRGAGDLTWVGDDFAPVIVAMLPEEETRLRVTFSEAVEEVSAETPAHYAIGGLAILAAQRDVIAPEQVLLTVTPMVETTYTLVVTGVADLFGNITGGAEAQFEYIDYGCPEGYYDDAAGLTGEDLQAALHAIIDDHTVYDYSFAWTAFYTTDDKPNGKVWDIYSDIPGGVPPYEYTFGVDQGGVGGQEGTGYTREHSWPKSWFGGEVSPMYTDLFALYPTDAHVNGTRGIYPYGEVASPTWTSLNGSELGPCSLPGYTGVVFEPIDGYKGDLARTYFYMGARYYGEDAGWPGSPMTNGAQLEPWALEMLVDWHAADPVSLKERERNAAVFAYQGNRNPFIDRPEFVGLVYQTAAAVDDGALAAASHGDVPRLLTSIAQARAGGALIRFRLPADAEITLDLWDVGGRRIAELAAGPRTAGPAEILWDGRLRDGGLAGSGVYFITLRTPLAATRGRLLLLR